MEVINLMTNNVRVLRNADANDRSWMLFPSRAAEFGVNLSDDIGGTEVNWNVLENIYVSEVKRDCAKLPEPAEGVVYIVPMAIALSSAGRTDLLYPSNPIADSNGNWDPSKGGYSYLAHAID